MEKESRKTQKGRRLHNAKKELFETLKFYIKEERAINGTEGKELKNKITEQLKTIKEIAFKKLREEYLKYPEFFPKY